jgi:hypothetical protein
MKKRWAAEPETRAKYERMAKGATNSADNDDDDGQDVQPDAMLAVGEGPELPTKSLKEIQRKRTKTFSSM